MSIPDDSRPAVRKHWYEDNRFMVQMIALVVYTLLWVHNDPHNEDRRIIVFLIGLGVGFMCSGVVNLTHRFLSRGPHGGWTGTILVALCLGILISYHFQAPLWITIFIGVIAVISIVADKMR